jgi:hypothetical protein
MDTEENIIECAERVNDNIATNLRENAFQKALMVELSGVGLPYTTEATIPVMYRGMPIATLHPDLVVGDSERYIIELKVNRDGTDQLLGYMNHAAEIGVDNVVGGIMINFGNSLDLNRVGTQ